MSLTILKLKEALKSEQETITSIEWEIIAEKDIGILPTETEKEYNKRIEKLNNSLHMHYDNLNLIKEVIKTIEKRSSNS